MTSCEDGDFSLKVPLPVTLLIDQKGGVRNVCLELIYFKHVEPKKVLEQMLEQINVLWL